MKNRPLRAARAWLALAAAAALGPQAPAAPAPAWTASLQTQLLAIDADNRADIGVYVRDLQTGASASYHAEETWYLASTVKLPVAIAVLRGVERGEWTLDTTLTLRAADYVDGAGQTNSHPAGRPLRLRFLLEQMMIYSDNTASDMLIGLVGIRNVNSLVQSLAPPGMVRAPSAAGSIPSAALPATVPGPPGFQPITSLSDVRRHIYGQLTPAADRLGGKDFILLKQQRSDADKREMLSRLLHVPTSDFRLPTVGQAYDAYYASGLNSGRLDAYGDMLTRLAQGEALGEKQTAWLLALMERVKTGTQRIKAGLPAGVRFAHKTGTQSARTCDSGLITVPRLGADRRIVVVACTRGEFSIAGSDRALRQVGAAICRSGLLTGGTAHDASCPPDPPRPPGSASRADLGLHVGPAEPDAGHD